MRVEPASSSDWQAITALLAVARLPLAGLDEQFPDAYVVIRDGEQLAGVAGLQRFGQFGLLRSVAVVESFRGSGIGRALVTERLAAARTAGLQAAYLLTTDAVEWFLRLGFQRIARDAAPGVLKASPELVDACPASAACLVLAIGQPEISST